MKLLELVDGESSLLGEYDSLYELVESALEMTRMYDWTIMSAQELRDISMLYHRNDTKEDYLVIRNHVQKRIEIICDECDVVNKLLDITSVSFTIIDDEDGIYYAE